MQNLTKTSDFKNCYTICYIKGISGNPAGKKPGTKNKILYDLRARVSRLLHSEFGSMKKSFMKLDDEKKVKAYIDLLSFVVPKQSKLDIEFGQMTDEQIDHIINELKSQS